MATLSNPQPARKAEPVSGISALSVDSLPFAAALIDRNGVVASSNREWLAAHPDAPPSRKCMEWCEQLRESMPGLSAALMLGIRCVLFKGQAQFSEDYTAGDRRRRLSVSPAADGALLVDQDLCPSLEPDDNRKRQSQKMEAVGRLTGGVAHDFANLLTLIAGYSEIVLGRIGEKDPLRPELEEISKAANRGARLTAQLLGFTRAQTVQPKVIDLNDLVADLKRMLRPLIGEYVELQHSLLAGTSKIVADPGQMEQVLMNLVLNARDAMPAGGRIVIETSSTELGPDDAQAHGVEPGPFVLLSVSDSGHGIDAVSQERLFEPFFTTKEKGKGTGLGLSTVHSIVKQGGGDVWVRSTPGEGATFTICLPLAQAPADNGDNTAASRTTPAGSETVLLVEDEDGVRRLLTHVLNKRGYQVIEAGSGEEALQIFEQRADEINLVITDMVMPKMSGRQLADRLLELRPETRVMFMSGYTDDVLARTGALGPGMSFLQKPLRPDVLAAKVREALDSPVRPFNPA